MKAVFWPWINKLLAKFSCEAIWEFTIEGCTVILLIQIEEKFLDSILWLQQVINFEQDI